MRSSAARSSTLTAWSLALLLGCSGEMHEPDAGPLDTPASDASSTDERDAPCEVAPERCEDGLQLTVGHAAGCGPAPETPLGCTPRAAYATTDTGCVVRGCDDRAFRVSSSSHAHEFVAANPSWRLGAPAECSSQPACD